MKERTKFWNKEDIGKYVICFENEREGSIQYDPHYCPIPLITKEEGEKILDEKFGDSPVARAHYNVYLIEDEYFPYKRMIN